jgi:ribose transport system ATP-binding protein
MPILQVQNVTMDFRSVRALSGVSIEFEPGEVHGIIGENGAGKSTLMKILSGVQKPTSGQILLKGAITSFHGVRDAQAHGIAMIHQELNLVDELAVFENVFLGREIVKAGLLDRAAMISSTEEALRQVSAGFSATDKVSDLSIAGKQLVEIAKAVAVNASILIMDEPTAVLSEPEAQSLFQLIAGLKERGVTVLYISHRLTEVCEVCDRITVLRDGAWIATVSSTGANPADLANLMVGRSLGDFYPPKAPAPPLKPILEVKDVRGASFAVSPGEIVGLAGLVGAGRTELAEAIIGTRPNSGAVRIDGKECRIKGPKDAMRCGIGYVSEDRKQLGLHVSLSSTHNMTMANLRAYGNFVLNERGEDRSAESWKKELDIRVGDLYEATANLSGGNQQKVSIAKWLETKPKILILDEPTRGVDVGAKREIYNLIQKLAAEGMAFLVISSELPEIIGLCHRALVMREGGLVGELRNGDLSEEAVMHLAAGVQAA